jgi:hypothetical protein
MLGVDGARSTVGEWMRIYPDTAIRCPATSLYWPSECFPSLDGEYRGRKNISNDFRASAHTRDPS